MLPRASITTKLARIAAPGMCLALVFYFGFHAAYGERGLKSLRNVQTESEQVRHSLAEAETRRIALQRRVRLISPPEIDGDLLEEEVRKLLGWSAHDDIIIIQKRRN